MYVPKYLFKLAREVAPSNTLRQFKRHTAALPGRGHWSAHAFYMPSKSFPARMIWSAEITDRSCRAECRSCPNPAACQAAHPNGPFPPAHPPSENVAFGA